MPEMYLDENADIGEYTPDLHFWWTFSKRVTIRNLLSHTSGLDLTPIGRQVKVPEEFLDLKMILTLAKGMVG